MLCLTSNIHNQQLQPNLEFSSSITFTALEKTINVTRFYEPDAFLQSNQQCQSTKQNIKQRLPANTETLTLTLITYFLRQVNFSLCFHSSFFPDPHIPTEVPKNFNIVNNTHHSTMSSTKATERLHEDYYFVGVEILMGLDLLVCRAQGLYLFRRRQHHCPLNFTAITSHSIKKLVLKINEK